MRNSTRLISWLNFGSRCLNRVFELIWSWRQDSNPRPSDYKSLALPTELRQLTIFWSGKRGSNPQPTAWKAVALPIELFPHCFFQYLVARVGFEPTKAMPTDLQSVPFGRSGISPRFLSINKQPLISTSSQEFHDRTTYSRTIDTKRYGIFFRMVWGQL